MGKSPAVRMMSEVIGYQTAMRRAQINVLGALAILALVLAAAGIHGLLTTAAACARPASPAAAVHFMRALSSD